MKLDIREREYMKLEAGCSGLLDFKFVARALPRLPSSFLSQLILLIVVREKEYIKLDVGKVVDCMT